ncbi:hypothetical protein IKF12_00565 [Candidatus Saccharibacteria bacterium]|nr:hypothetical protein [Candidatus Saccharibacteria bacterium]
MAQKAKKSTKTKKPATKKTTTKTVKKPATTTIKSSVTVKNQETKPAIGKIICLVAIVASLLVIIVAVMAINFGGGNNLFVSDGTKYVLNITADEDNDENVVATHQIFYYKDDEITGVKTYYEFANASDAKAEYDAIQELLDDEEKSAYKLDGKYIVVTSPEEEYADMTASDVKSYIELYEKIQNGEISTDEEETVEETEEETEE